MQIYNVISPQGWQTDDLQLPGGEAGRGHHPAPSRHLELCPGKLSP